MNKYIAWLVILAVVVMWLLLFPKATLAPHEQAHIPSLQSLIESGIVFSGAQVDYLMENQLIWTTPENAIVPVYVSGSQLLSSEEFIAQYGSGEDDVFEGPEFYVSTFELRKKVKPTISLEHVICAEVDAFDSGSYTSCFYNSYLH